MAKLKRKEPTKAPASTDDSKDAESKEVEPKFDPKNIKRVEKKEFSPLNGRAEPAVVKAAPPTPPEDIATSPVLTPQPFVEPKKDKPYRLMIWIDVDHYLRELKELYARCRRDHYSYPKNSDFHYDPANRKFCVLITDYFQGQDISDGVMKSHLNEHGETNGGVMSEN